MTRAQIRTFRRSTSVKTVVTSIATFSGVANLLMLVPAFSCSMCMTKLLVITALRPLWALSLITAFLFVVLGSMEWIRSRVLVAISTRMDKILAPSIYRFTFQNAVNVGGQQATIQPLADLMGLRQFLTGAGILLCSTRPGYQYIWPSFCFIRFWGGWGFWHVNLSGLSTDESAPSWQGSGEVESVSTDNQRRDTSKLRNAEVATSMGMVPELQQRWQTNQDKLLAFQERASLTAGGFNAITKTLRLAVQSAAIAAGAYLFSSRNLTGNDDRRIDFDWSSSTAGRAGGRRMERLCKAKEQYERLNQNSNANSPASSKMSLPPLVGKILLKIWRWHPQERKQLPSKASQQRFQPARSV